jgi:hypothetical protein
MSEDDLERTIDTYTDAYQALEAFVRGPKPVDGAHFSQLWDEFKKAERKYDEACRARGWTPPYRGDS